MSAIVPLKEESYDTTFKYLEYDDWYDKISIPIRIRERHLTEDTDCVSLQAVGTRLHAAIWSKRDNVIFQFPFRSFTTSSVTQRKLTGRDPCMINVGQFEDVLDNDESSIDVTVIVHNLPRR